MNNNFAQLWHYLLEKILINRDCGIKWIIVPLHPKSNIMIHEDKIIVVILGFYTCWTDTCAKAR